MNYIKHTALVILYAALVSFPVLVAGQGSADAVRGVVRDVYGNPLSEAVIMYEDGTAAAISDRDGNFSLTPKPGAGRLVVRHPGYRNAGIDLSAPGDEHRVELIRDSYRGDDLVEGGLSTFRKVEVSGSIATAYGSDIEKSPTMTAREAFSGRFPGLFSRELSSDPANANTQFWIRGASIQTNSHPVLVVDGVVFDYAQEVIMNMISAAEIESVSVLKDAASQALYGIQGGDGIIVITTKKGKPGDLRINVRADATLQQVTMAPSFPSSAVYATLRNQAAYNDGRGPNHYFSEDAISKFLSGEDREHYPNHNWYNEYFRKVVFAQRANVDATGGNEIVNYYANVNFMHQGNMFKTEETKFNPRFQLYWVNFRSNIDVKLNKYLSATLRLSGNIQRDNTPTATVGSIYSSLFDLPPTMYGPLTPEIVDPVTGDVLVEGGNVVRTERSDSFYGRMNRTGYGKTTYTNVYTQVGLKLDMDFLTKGLDLSGNVGYRAENHNVLNTTQQYEKWYRNEQNLETLSFTKYGTDENLPLSRSKNHMFCYIINYQGRLDYRRSFGRHHVSGLAYAFFQRLIKNDTSGSATLPYNRLSTGYEATYNYDDRYILRLDAGYSGSEQYARSNRFTWTPAFSAAYVLSNEKFVKDAAPWLSMLKLRGSYGMTATDRSNLIRFSYLDELVLNNIPNWLNYIIGEANYGNPGIHAEKIRKTNYGMDVGLYDRVNLSFDYFKERSTEMVIRSSNSIPDYYGYTSGGLYPYMNDGIFKNQGYEITADYFQQVGKDLSFGVGGMFFDARNRVVYSGEESRGEGYAAPYRIQGYPLYQTFGYLVDYSNGNGFFNFQDEIDNGPTYNIGTPRLGDLKYVDVNGDGVIDEADQVPLGNGGLPRQAYSFYGTVRYKGFELYVMFNGVGKWKEVLNYDKTEFSGDGKFSRIHERAWTFERFMNGEKITYPALGTQESSSYPDSDYFLYNRAYIRLKNVEIAYNLPKKVSAKLGIDNIRVALSGQNLLTWDRLGNKDFGPESGGKYQLPVLRLYNIGVRVQF